MDKLKHFAVCLAIALVAGAILHPIAGAVLALAIGAAKELRDARGFGTPCWGDMAANTGGALTGAGLAYLLT